MYKRQSARMLKVRLDERLPVFPPVSPSPHQDNMSPPPERFPGAPSQSGTTTTTTTVLTFITID